MASLRLVLLLAVLFSSQTAFAWLHSSPCGIRGSALRTAANGALCRKHSRTSAERVQMSSSEISTTSGTDVEAAAPGTLRPVILCPAQFGTAADYEDLKVHPAISLRDVRY
eukprot:423566-Rhodomonas_salina.4